MLRTRLPLRMLGSLLAAAVAVLVLAASASAGTFSVNSCGQSPAQDMTGWSHDETSGPPTGLPYFYDGLNCGSFGMYRRFENTTIAAGAYSAWTFTPPAGTWIDQAFLNQSVVIKSAGAYDAVYADLEDGTRRLVASYLSTSGSVGDTTYSMPAGTPHPVRLRTELGCQASAGNCSGLWNGEYGNVWLLTGSVIQLWDPSLPTFSSVSGAGWQATPNDGVSSFTYDVADQGAGVSKVRFLVDGVEFAANVESCTVGRYVPCPLHSSGQFALDTTRLSEGQHTIALTASDFSSNVTLAADKQLTITVRRPPQQFSTVPVTTSNPSANGGGSPAVGDQLSGNAGGWSGNANTYTYQWQRCDAQGLSCSPIAGANGLNYTATSSDVGKTLEFCVTATNSGGSSTSCSAPTPAVVGSRTVTTPADTRPGDTPPVSSGGTGSTHATVGSGAVAQPDRGAANGSPAADRVVLWALANSRTSTQKVKFGKRVPISGRLVGPNGVPIGGATLTVQVQTAVPGASMADAARVVTGPDGRFTYMAPAGPSRTIRFGYRSYSADTSFADTTDVRLLVAAGVTMTATPKKVRNKHATVFKGRLLGKPIAKRGVVVDLQVFFRKQWRTFAAPRTNRAGLYKFKYRFMAGAATWKFRARVRKETSYPYEIGFSLKTVKVKVTR